MLANVWLGASLPTLSLTRKPKRKRTVRPVIFQSLDDDDADGDVRPAKRARHDNDTAASAPVATTPVPRALRPASAVAAAAPTGSTDPPPAFILPKLQAFPREFRAPRQLYGRRHGPPSAGTGASQPTSVLPRALCQLRDHMALFADPATSNAARASAAAVALVYGPPQCGKTFAVVELARQMGVRLLTLDTDALRSEYLESGTKEKRKRRTAAVASAAEGGIFANDADDGGDDERGGDRIGAELMTALVCSGVAELLEAALPGGRTCNGAVTVAVGGVGLDGYRRRQHDAEVRRRALQKQQQQQQQQHNGSHGDACILLLDDIDVSAACDGVDWHRVAQHVAAWFAEHRRAGVSRRVCVVMTAATPLDDWHIRRLRDDTVYARGGGRGCDGGGPCLPLRFVRPEPLALQQFGNAISTLGTPVMFLHWALHVACQTGDGGGGGTGSDAAAGVSLRAWADYSGDAKRLRDTRWSITAETMRMVAHTSGGNLCHFLQGLLMAQAGGGGDGATLTQQQRILGHVDAATTPQEATRLLLGLDAVPAQTRHAALAQIVRVHGWQLLRNMTVENLSGIIDTTATPAAQADVAARVSALYDLLSDATLLGDQWTAWAEGRSNLQHCADWLVSVGVYCHLGASTGAGGSGAVETVESRRRWLVPATTSAGAVFRELNAPPPRARCRLADVCRRRAAESIAWQQASELERRRRGATEALKATMYDAYDALTFHDADARHVMRSRHAAPLHEFGDVYRVIDAYANSDTAVTCDDDEDGVYNTNWKANLRRVLPLMDDWWRDRCRALGSGRA